MIKAGIIGAAGYTGGELLRLLLNHPQVELSFAHSESQQGKLISLIHQDLFHYQDLRFTGELIQEVDVIFLCMGHGESAKFLQKYTPAPGVRIIDLSQDFRVESESNPKAKSFTYGLPEINRQQIAEATFIANPGCFATGIMLGLLPLFHHGFTSPIFATGITGSTGAGRKLSDSAHFSWRNNNIQAYKSLNHQHIAEVSATLQSANVQSKPDIRFIPWRGDFPRGIMLSMQFETEMNQEQLSELYKTFYASHPFTHVSDDPIHLKQVVNTNHCLIQIEQLDHHTVVHVVIDNLLKGASGQAVQNMNIMFGLPETEGLSLKAQYF